MYKFMAMLVVAAVAIAGCGRKESKPVATNDASAAGAKYLTQDEPTGAQPVAEAMKAAEDQAEVTIVGRIGGEKEPWVEDLAAFMIVDPSLKPCNEIPGDTCDTPWDYCCEKSETMQTHSVTVKFADEKGGVVPVDARKLFDLKPLQTVVVKGRLQKDKSGNMSVVAEKMHVRK